MILQLSPDKVAENWNHLEPLFMSVVPERFRDETTAISMLRAILMEECQVWQIISAEEKVLGYGITEIRSDVLIGINYLYLSLLIAENLMDIHMWKEALRSLKAYGLSRACLYVQATTAIEEVARLASMLGGNSEQKLIEFGVV